ncbi:MAG: hypothetical protein MK102_03640 [Fuerstiella sp.]|nr:hypothetical protein [Fuerstiella sp.]
MTPDRCTIFFLICLSIAACDRSSRDVISNSSAGDQSSADADSKNHDSDRTVDQNLSHTDEYAEMEAALPLSNEEVATLKSAFQTRQTAISSWMEANGDTLEQLEKQMAAAARSRNLAGLRKAKAEATPLRNELRDLIEAHEKSILGALSIENATAWNAHRLSQRVLSSMKPLDLNKEQISQIQIAAVTVVESVMNKKNPEAAGFLALEKTAESQVLTSDQRTAYQMEKKKSPMRSLQ